MPDIFVAEDKEQEPNTPKQTISPRELPRGMARHQIPGHTHNPVSAFNYFPDKVKFVAADKEEKIVLLLRRHPITNLRWIVLAILMLFAPFFLSFFPPLTLIPGNFQLVILMSWYMITTAFIIENFINWFFNVDIVTDERLFDVDFINLIYREISEANIDQIQDVTVEVGGAIRTIFNYGDILIQTASEVPRIEFLGIPKPDVVAQILRDLRVEEEQEKLEGRVR
jgi:uncharacterized membrane protein YdbT with pleckstrin-like domain